MLDNKDIAILKLLEKNCKTPVLELGGKTGMPATTVHNRMMRLEKDGVIEGYHAKVNQKKIGNLIQAFINVTVQYTLPSGKKISQEELAKKIKAMPQVQEVYILTGETDILVKASLKDTDALNDFVINRLRGMDGVDKVRTAIILSEVL